MRKVVFGVASTLDNYIAREDQSFDWIVFDEDTQAALADFWKDIDTVVLGRKTWEVARAHTPEGAEGGGSYYPGVKSYVLSRSLPPDAAGGDEEIVSEDVVEFLGRLKEQDGKTIFFMGGGELANPVLEAGLIDELSLGIHPLLLGSGVPLFHGLAEPIQLELIESQSSSSGCVSVRYRVLR